MKRLCFGIPTWNRAKKLEICVREIARQIIELGEEKNIGIFVSDNCSDDDTPRVLAKLKKEYPFLDYCRLNKHVMVLHNLASVIRNAQGEYIWLFGDDDILLKDGLRTTWHVINTKEADIIHAGNAWLKPHSYKTYQGYVLEFANKMGFNQFIGWISSIIVKKEIAQQVIQLPQWSNYVEQAYGYVVGFLHVAAYNPALVIDFPIAQPMEPQTEEDIKRWEAENIGWRYFLTIEGFQTLFQLGVLKEKFKPMFFKYLSYYLWDRFITNMIGRELAGKPFPEKGWDLILAMADMIDDLDMAKKIRNTTIAARQLCETRKNLINQINDLNKILVEIINETNKDVFPWGWGGDNQK